MPLTSPIVVWDVDDVLNDLTLEWLRSERPEDLDLYESLLDPLLHLGLGLNERDYLASLDHFRMHGGFEAMEPRADVLVWFREHGDRARHIALTSTPLRTAPVSATWVMRHFGRWIRTFHVVPSKRPEDDSPALDPDKEHALRFLGLGSVMIDDRPDNLDGARQAGLQVIRFPRPWNGGGSPLAALDQLTDMICGASSTTVLPEKDAV